MVESRKLKFERDEPAPSVRRCPPAVQRQLAEGQVQSGKGALAGPPPQCSSVTSPRAAGRTSGGDPLDPRKAVEAFIEAHDLTDAVLFHDGDVQGIARREIL